MLSKSDAIVDPSVEAALCALEAGAGQVSKVRTDALSNRDRLTMLRRVETVLRALPAVGLELVSQMNEQWDTSDFATNNLVDTLADGLRITPAEARARWRAADDLAHHTSFTGEVLAPPLPATAQAQADGTIGPAHVKIVRDTINHLPCTVDAGTKAQAEAELADHATRLRPDQLRKVADKLEALINPDGTFNDADRARRRSFTLGRQGPDLMSKCTLVADPELRAYLEAVLAKYAKPGVCNPDDEKPCVEGDPGRDAEVRDPRNAAQRQHDALKTVLRDSIASGRLGQHRGLPVTVIVSMTLRELESAVAAVDPECAGIDVSGPPVATGGGAMIPIRDALRLASHAHHYLAVFDNHTGRPLYLGRSKRIATADQRIVLHARDIGCTYPGCTKPGYLCQTHHRTEWSDGGLTDADQLTFVCEPHHRTIGTTPTDWRTTTPHPGHPKAGRTHWIPPSHIDPTQHPRMNHYHHPGEYLAPTPQSSGPCAGHPESGRRAALEVHPSKNRIKKIAGRCGQ
ncbi:HNH endonuclease signature motif containing protein [Nocardia terpenica]|uniref:HNH nuclease domain-containing protein n=1 Tax=Nocardia terpenica TaxID=455432 RepID=A0A291RQC3_9NOCA|nr:HNH endonuclease signature motif containing protein [Nocardia terpenica]ATL69746.1 hypothetical protein CRH09_29820 [Nocardia terpenica]